MMWGCLAQYFYSINGRIQWSVGLQVEMTLWWIKKTTGTEYTLGAQPYDFEPHWLISNFFMTHYHS